MEEVNNEEDMAPSNPSRPLKLSDSSDNEEGGNDIPDLMEFDDDDEPEDLQRQS